MTAHPYIFLAWQCPTTRKILPVGRLVDLGAEGYEFSYIRAVEAAKAAGFRPLLSFPSLDEIYRSRELPPLFSNRVMPASRPDYPAFVSELGLPRDVGPLELMERSGGRRATDELEVFAPPRRAADGSHMHVLVRGIRHIPGAEEAVASVNVGEQLLVLRDGQNAHAGHARLLRTGEVRPVGYLPDYLAQELERIGAPRDPLVTVVQVNPPPVTVHHRLLCRVDLPASVSLFQSEDYLPLSPEATRVAA